MKVTKAIIPAAGLGTRFLPQTKAMPKEMLPIIDKPIIQYVVEEAVSAGITDIIIVTGAHKRSIEDHFDHQYELEAKLDKAGKENVAQRLRDIADMANFVYVRQKGPYGNGTPILNVAHLLGDEPFLVLWADDFFRSKITRSQQLLATYEELSCPVISLIPISAEQTSLYGVPELVREVKPNLFQIGGLVEKPGPVDAPCLFSSVGGYVLTPEIIPLLEQQKPDRTGEIYLSAAINQLAKQTEVYGKVIEGKWHDTGNKQSYLEAIVDVALSDPELGGDFRDYLEHKLAE